MSLIIQPTYITDLKKFEGAKKWRAITISKEKRTKGEFYFAYIVRFYGEDEQRGDYDVSEESKDFAWLGRNVTAIGKRTFSKDPETPGKRIYEEAEWEERENQVTKEKYKVLVKGKRIWDYTIPVNEQNTKLMKSIVGDIGLNQITTFQMLKGTTYPISVDEDTFFKTPVDEVMKNHIEKIVRVKNTAATKKE